MCRAPRGARGLKYVKLGQNFWRDNSRAPRGARGLKFEEVGIKLNDIESCPSRGTWIEITGYVRRDFKRASRAPRGARGLKCLLRSVDDVLLPCRAPRGARGLKSLAQWLFAQRRWSCPSRGTWIEMPKKWLILRISESRAPRGARGLKCCWRIW